MGRLQPNSTPSNRTGEKRGRGVCGRKIRAQNSEFYRQRLEASWGHKLRCQDLICEDIVLYVHQTYLVFIQELHDEFNVD